MEAKIKSLERALKILECFSEDEPELGVTQISKKLNMHKSTVFNIVDTFAKHGYLEQNLQTGKYRLGLKLLQLSYILYSNYDLRKVLHSHMQEIVRETDETVYLGVLSEGEVLYLDAVFPASHAAIRNIVGIKAPLYCTAIGKALLASLTDQEIRDIIEKPLRRYTENTITDAAVLWQEVGDIRRKGFAVDNMEHEYGIKCVGAAIKGTDGRPVCAISISGPSLRFDQEHIDRYAALLRDVKAKVEKIIL